MAGSYKSLAAPALENSQKRCDYDVYASKPYHSLEILALIIQLELYQIAEDIVR